jgi:hypothetical protein
MTADTKLTPPERSANQGRSFAAAECTAYLSVVWRAVDVDGHGDELPPGPPVRPGGAVLGIPWVPVTVHSDTGTSLAPSRFNSTLYPSLVSWLTVSAADIPHKSRPLRQPSPLTDVSNHNGRCTCRGAPPHRRCRDVVIAHIGFDTKQGNNRVVQGCRSTAQQWEELT